ncbi:hypothetical protein [Pontibacter mangrovi]|uniref:DNA topoisomerase IV n=1 Tax=Pontibacter mangrovi TaxID=2589816 RepID=A0A501WCQ9_9BACT|nr:hypothetical protein [Pontibacter mangrovi]TPE44637.1 hypothetical protein FJM65_06295 [Pontibacter mangrovi]
MLYLLSLILIGYTSFSTNTCQSIKSGTFKTVSHIEGAAPITTIIERVGDIQYERSEQLGAAYKFKVEWINDCTYTLTWLETIKDENNFGYPEEMVLTIEVLEVNADYYIQSASSNLFDDKIEGRVEIIK